jgi:hypothetical protein
MAGKGSSCSVEGYAVAALENIKKSEKPPGKFDSLEFLEISFEVGSLCVHLNC